MNTFFTKIRTLSSKCTGCIALCAIFLTTSGLLYAGSPPVTLTCPDDVVITAAPEECGAYLDYNTLVWSSTVPLTDTLFDPGPGYFFETGVTDVSLAATDTSGVLWTCTFTVTVNDGGPIGLPCDDNVPVYIGDSCWSEVTWDMILEGGPYGCPDNYEVMVLSPIGENLGNIVNLSFVGTTWTVKVTNTLNGQSCWGSINVLTDSLPPGITCPTDTVILCNMDGSPANAGQPFITGCIDSADLTIEFMDQRTNSYCDGDSIAFHILRNWRATDPYNNETTCQQNIYARRAHLSEIVFPPSYDGTDLPPIACSDTTGYLTSTDTSQTGVPTLAGLELSGNSVPCDIAVFFTDSITHVCGAKYIVKREWTAFDFCESEEVVYVQTLVVQDDQPPVFSIPDTLWVSSGTTCGVETTLPPISLAFECSSFSVEILTPWDTLQSNGGVVNVPKVPGVFNILYTATDACDNAAAELSIMMVQQGIVSACPNDTVIACNYFNEALKDSLEAGAYGVLAPFGEPVFYNNCSFDLSETASVAVDSCGEGFIYRTITIEDPNQPEQCFQNIQVVQVSDFVVEFPADITVTCGQAPAEFGEPALTGNGCENLAVWHTDQTFTVIPDACYKIKRTWYVANLCVIGDSLDQEVVELPESQLGLPFPDCDLDGDGDCDNRTFRDSWNDDAMPGIAEASNIFGPDTDDDSDPWDGYIVYEQIIKVIDNVDPVFLNNCQIPAVVIPDTACEVTIMLPLPEIEECSSVSNVTAEIKIDGVWEQGFGPHYFLPPGDYEVEYNAYDNCNNHSFCATTLSVIDPPPVAVCKLGLSVELDPFPFPMVQIWAGDFDDGSYDNCPSGIVFSFSSDPDSVTHIFDCYDIGQQLIQLWVTDASGNQDYCETFIIVLDPPGTSCEPYEIGGSIATEDLNGIANVQVTFSDGYVTNTESNGFYYYFNAPSNDLGVVPFKDDNHLNGVSTFDGVLLVKHVLGMQILDSPYKMIAADVNKSNSVTTFDAVEMRKLILGITQKFPNNTSWRFVPKDFVFPNPQNPFASVFPEIISMGPPYNFIGIKIGDLNNSAIPAFAGEIDERFYTGEAELGIANLLLKKGEVYEIPFSPDTAPLSGFQFALRFDPARLSLLKIKPGYAGPECFGTAGLAGGQLKTSWYSAAPVVAEKGRPAFTLLLEATEDGWLRDALTIDETEMAAEAYSAGLEQLHLLLNFEESGSSDSEFRLLSVRPNPFSEITAIEYFLERENRVTLTISGLSGRVVYEETRPSGTGRQAWKIGRREIPEPGLYIYRLKCGDGWAAGKLLVE
jgi:HYR domain